MEKTLRISLRIFLAALLGAPSLATCLIIPVGEFFWFSLLIGAILAAFGYSLCATSEF